MNHTTAHRALAMAGIFQAAYLVQQVARRGNVSETAVAASINSLFQLDPDNAAAVFGGIDGLAIGLRFSANSWMASTPGATRNCCAM